MSIISKLVFLALFFLCIFFNAKNSFAIESRSTREAIVSPRTKKFYKGSRAKQYLSLTGNYSSDNNSRNYQATSRYLYQSANFIHEFKTKMNSYFSQNPNLKKMYEELKKTNKSNGHKLFWQLAYINSPWIHKLHMHPLVQDQIH